MRFWPILTLLALAAPNAFAEDVASTPEKEAVGMFTQMCLVSEANPKKTAILIDPLIKAKVAGKIPGEVVARSGIKAEHSWFIKMPKTSQELLVTISPGICALHVKTGDGKALKKEFVRVSEMFAEALKSKLVQKETKAITGAEYSAYTIDIGKDDIEGVLAISIGDKVGASGTKHLLTFSPYAKKD